MGKGSKRLPFKRVSRKRGGVSKKRLKPGQLRQQERPVKKVPVLVACDRQRDMVSKVFGCVWWEEIEPCLVERIAPSTYVWADVLAQDGRVAGHLGFVLKTLVTLEGQTVREGVFHATC